MAEFQKYLSTIPVIFLILLSFTAILLIEINNFFPDSLMFDFF